MKAGTQQGHAASIRPLDGLDLLASDFGRQMLAPAGSATFRNGCAWFLIASLIP